MRIDVMDLDKGNTNDLVEQLENNVTTAPDGQMQDVQPTNRVRNETHTTWVVEDHGDVTTSNRLPHYWPFVKGINRPPSDSPHNEPVLRNIDVVFTVSFNSLRGFP